MTTTTAPSSFHRKRDTTAVKKHIPFTHMTKGPVTILLLVMFSGCSAPLVWTQFHGDGANQGFVLVASAPAVQPRWAVPVGPAGYSSPALAGDGAIFVGTTEGQLVGVNNNGTVRFRQQLLPAPAIVSSPTVSPNGAVLAVATTRTDDTFTSTLFSVSLVNGSINWSQPLPAGYFSTAAPKTWGTEHHLIIILPVQSVFIPVSTDLFIFNTAGQVLTHAERCVEVTGGTPIPSDWWRIFTAGLPFTFTVAGLPEEDPIGPLHPSVAVVDRGGSALILVSTRCALIAWQWTGADLLWTWEKDRDGIDASSPAVINRDIVVVGRSDGSVQAYDASTGSPQWTFSGQDSVKATPAGFVSFLYVVSLSTVYKLDERDGTVLASQQLNAMTVASPALSAQRVYVSTANGLWTFSADLASQQFADVPGGFSSPAIGPDGTVYIVSTDKLLRAYR